MLLCVLPWNMKDSSRKFYSPCTVFWKFAHKIWIKSITIKDKYNSITFDLNSTETKTKKFCLKVFSIHPKMKTAKTIRLDIATLFRAEWYTIYMDIGISKQQSRKSKRLLHLQYSIIDNIFNVRYINMFHYISVLYANFMKDPVYFL